MSKTEDFPPDLPLAACRAPGVYFHLPMPISNRLDRLVDRITTEGTVARRDLVAGLILCAPEDPQALTTYIRLYRAALVKDAELSDTSSGEILKLPHHKPGRRPKKSSA